MRERNVELAIWLVLLLLTVAVLHGYRWAVIGLLLGFLWPSGRREG